MSDEKAVNKSESDFSDVPKHLKTPTGVQKECTFLGQKVRVEADWVTLHHRDEPVGDMFYVGYFGDDDSRPRPLTFVFNGGPGASAAFLHMGGVGPQRVVFGDDGSAPPPPVRLAENAESWLPFTDLVFVDPIGTGFSRVFKQQQDEKEKSGAWRKEASQEEKQYYQVNKDLDSLCEFISRFLTLQKGWKRPIFIAGESYGGYRIAKLARKLQEDTGIGLNGAIVISPALEWYLLEASDYDIQKWLNLVPTFAAIAHHHGKSREGSLSEICFAAEDFALNQCVALLASGDAMPETRQKEILGQLAQLTGLRDEVVQLSRGRISLERFCRELLRDQNLWLGAYDGSVTATDPFPDREHFQGADPTLSGIARIFSAGTNAWLRDFLGLKTDRDYHILNMEVNTSWKLDESRHAFHNQVGAMDDLRVGMALNPYLKVYFTHGIYDLVTPYFATNRVVNLSRFTEAQKKNITLQHFEGGHMFYLKEKSRVGFKENMSQFYRSALEA